MKLVELLAKEMDKWPEGCTCGYCVQANESTEVFFGGPARSIFLSAMADDHEDARVTTEQWQAERDRQKCGEWKRHRGGKRPVDPSVRVECRMRNGDVEESSAGGFMWDHNGAEDDVMKYRVISQPQAEEVEYRGPFPSAPIGEPENAIEFDIEFPSGVFKLEAQVDQIDGPIKWRDTVNELDAYIEEFTRERDALIDRLAEEGFSLIGKINKNLDKIDAALDSFVDMSDWRNWKAGDLVTYDHISTSNFTSGKQYTLSRVDEKRLSIDYDDAGDDNGWLTKYFKWHSRQ